MASTAASNLDTVNRARVSPSMCLANFGQLSKPCSRAITSCAAASVQAGVRPPAVFTVRHRAWNRTAAPLSALQFLTRAFARFL